MKNKGMFTLEISKECYRDDWMIKKSVKNITKLRTQSKGKGFKNLLHQDESKLKWIIVKQSLLTIAQIFEKARIESKTKDVEYFINWEL